MDDFRAIRESNGVSLNDVAQQTKISKRFLEAIEAGRLEDLPGGIYRVSYIRQYLQACGWEASASLADHHTGPAMPNEGDLAKAVEMIHSGTMRARTSPVG